VSGSFSSVDFSSWVSLMGREVEVYASATGRSVCVDRLTVDFIVGNLEVPAISGSPPTTGMGKALYCCVPETSCPWELD